MIKAVIFDWDEVIAQTDSFNQYALSHALTQRGLLFSRELYQRYFQGRSLKDGLQAYLHDMAQPDHLFEELSAAKKAFDAEFARLIMPYDDALALILRLRGNYKLAIASGTRRVLCNTGIKKFDLVGVFDVVVTSEEYENGKPDPEAFIVALKNLNKICDYAIQPQNVLVIEDSPLGVRAAKAARMMCVAVTHTHPAHQLKEADVVVDDLRNLDVDGV